MSGSDPGKLSRWAEVEDRRFIHLIDAALADAHRRAGNRMACRIGCTQCCIGPFPISSADAYRLMRAHGESSSVDGSRASAIRARATAALASGNGDTAAYPVLDPASGACELYDVRPVSCRTYGPPVRLGDTNLQPCELCFVGATSAEIAQARVTIDDEDVERQIIEAPFQAGRAASFRSVADAIVNFEDFENLRT